MGDDIDGCTPGNRCRRTRGNGGGKTYYCRKFPPHNPAQVNHDKGRTFKIIQQTLEDELGYKVQYRVIDARSWVPQHRERIFIAGFREANGFDFDDLVIPDPLKLGSILHPGDGWDTACHSGEAQGKIPEGSASTPANTGKLYRRCRAFDQLIEQGEPIKAVTAYWKKTVQEKVWMEISGNLF